MSLTNSTNSTNSIDSVDSIDSNENDYGYVYCMINKYMPHLCKIGYVNKPGKTSRDRAKELSSNTCCPIDFEVIFDIKVKNPHKYEKKIHKKLNHLRINSRREFFECKPEDIIKYFEKTNLIMYDDENDDFPEVYLTKYRILRKYNINNLDNIDNVNNINIRENRQNRQIIEKKNILVFVSCKEVFIDIYNVFYIIFKLFVSIMYYFYITLKVMFNLIKK